MSGWLLPIVAILLSFAWIKYRRHTIALTITVVLSVALIFPAPSYAQLGIIGGIRSLLGVINGSIKNVLNDIGIATQTLDDLHEKIVWPVRLIKEARATISSLSGLGGALSNINTSPVHSATLPFPVALESTLRNVRVNDFASLVDAYTRTYGVIPSTEQSDAGARNLVDTHDAMTLATLKTAKESDLSIEMILAAGDRIQEEAEVAAPGSVPFLTASSVAAEIQSQALMQKMLAAMIRQESTRIAQENARRKRTAMLVNKARQGISDILNRN